MAQNTLPQRKVNSAATDYNAVAFQIQRALSEISTAEPVTVGAVHIPDPKGPVGFVDVRPLTKIVDGEGKGVTQEQQFKLPYLRTQGGKNALIIDPQPGDKGLAVYAMRDTETLKETRGDDGPVNPGSGRTLDQGDGFYLGGFLNGAPERWVWVHDDGIELEGVDNIHTHGKITIMDAEDGWTVNAESGATINAEAGTTINVKGGGLTVNGDVLVNGSITWTGTAHGRGGGAAEFDRGVRVLGGGIQSNGGFQNSGGITDNGKNVGSTHTHSGVETGGGTTGEPT